MLLHEDQTAELCTRTGAVLVGRGPIYRVARRLDELGYGWEDLKPDH